MWFTGQEACPLPGSGLSRKSLLAVKCGSTMLPMDFTAAKRVMLAARPIKRYSFGAAVFFSACACTHADRRLPSHPASRRRSCLQIAVASGRPRKELASTCSPPTIQPCPANRGRAMRGLTGRVILIVESVEKHKRVLTKALVSHSWTGYFYETAPSVTG